MFLAVLILGAAAARGQQAGGGETRSVAFTAVDKEGKPVGTLLAEDVRVVVDGAERKIVGLRQRRDLPVHFVLMLDASASQERILPGAKRAADAFVEGLMRPGADRAAVITFAGEMTMVQALTGDVGAVRDAIARVRFVAPPGYIGGGVVIAGRPPKNAPPPAGSTAVWDSVYNVAHDVLGRGTGPERRVVLLITDGVDTSSDVKTDDAIKAALWAGVFVYVVGVGDKEFNDFDGMDKGPLRKVAEQTGGRAFFPTKDKELSAAFTQMRDELLAPYVVTFEAAPRRDDKPHKLEIEIANPLARRPGLKLAYPRVLLDGPPPAPRRRD